MGDSAVDGGAYSVVVLAGGQGTRFGGDKTAARFQEETLLERAIRRSTGLSTDLIVAGRSLPVSGVANARTVSDLAPYRGVLAGIAAGLAACRHPWALVLASDMPFVNHALITYLASLRPGYDVVVPRLPVGLEPLHAFYSVRCLTAVGSALAAGRRRVTSFFDAVRVRYAEEAEILRHDPEKRSFININTTEDLARAARWLREEAEGMPNTQEPRLR